MHNERNFNFYVEFEAFSHWNFQQSNITRNPTSLSLMHYRSAQSPLHYRSAKSVHYHSARSAPYLSAQYFGDLEVEGLKRCTLHVYCEKSRVVLSPLT